MRIVALSVSIPDARTQLQLSQFKRSVDGGHEGPVRGLAKQGNGYRARTRGNSGVARDHTAVGRRDHLEPWIAGTAITLIVAAQPLATGPQPGGPEKFGPIAGPTGFPNSSLVTPELRLPNHRSRCARSPTIAKKRPIIRTVRALPRLCPVTLL